MSEIIVDNLVIYQTSDGLTYYARDSEKNAWKKSFTSEDDPDFCILPGAKLNLDSWSNASKISENGKTDHSPYGG